MSTPYKDLSDEEKKRDWKEITYQVVLVGTIAGMIWLSAERTVQTRRPVYESREACLADWNNTPADCEEDKSSGGGSGGGRRWYGPDVDDNGRAYHADGHTSDGHTHLSTLSFRGSSISRGGFGRGFSRGG